MRFIPNGSGGVGTSIRVSDSGLNFLRKNELFWNNQPCDSWVYFITHRSYGLWIRLNVLSFGAYPILAVEVRMLCIFALMWQRGTFGCLIASNGAHKSNSKLCLWSTASQISSMVDHTMKWIHTFVDRWARGNDHSRVPEMTIGVYGGFASIIVYQRSGAVAGRAWVRGFRYAHRLLLLYIERR